MMSGSATNVSKAHVKKTIADEATQRPFLPMELHEVQVLYEMHGVASADSMKDMGWTGHCDLHL